MFRLIIHGQNNGEKKKVLIHLLIESYEEEKKIRGIIAFHNRIFNRITSLIGFRNKKKRNKVRKKKA